MPSLDSFELPPRKTLADFLNQEPASSSGKNTVFAKVEKVPRKGKSWSEEEHLAFLTGLSKLGKGNWRGIARYYVPTRTSTQIASHAQKYLQRVSGTTKRKSKFSEIEQQASEMHLTKRIPSPETAFWGTDSKQRCSPTGSADLSEGSEPQRGGHSQRGSQSHRGDPPRRQSQALMQPYQPEKICRPTPIRAVESEPDLIRLAHSLMSLNPSRRLSPSDTSAFRSAEPIKQMAG